MLSRILLGTGVSVSAVVASSQFMVAHAASPLDEDDIPPIYDDEVESAPPLPGSTLPATTRSDTKLVEAEKKVSNALDIEHVKAEGRVYKVSKLIQGYLGTAREAVNSQLAQAELKSQEWSNKYRQSERSAAETVASLKSEQEDLLPGSIYVLISGLSGSIFARRRNFLVRSTVPWLFGGVAFAYFLPQTWDKTRKLAWHFEQQQLPSVAQQHIKAQESLESWAKQSTETYQDTKKQAKGSLKSARDKIREWTGR